ncbi:MAG: TolC family protein [Vicinamibacterales bacterium]
MKRDRFGPEIAELDVRAASTAWTPEFATHVRGAGSDASSSNAIDGGARLTDRELSSEIGLSQRLPWGSAYRIRWDAARETTNSVFARFQPEMRASVGATVVQQLLRGFTFDEARAERGISLQAREMADRNLAAARAATTRAVLHAYWTWVHARDFLAVQRQSLAMAQALLDGNRTRVARGALATVDVIEAEAEVARRAELILIAEKNVANAEDRLRLHIFDPAAPRRDVVLEPETRAEERPVTADATTRALAERHDLKSLQASMAIDAINIRRFRNGALPEVFLRVDYALSGTAGTERLRGSGFPGPITGTSDRSFSSALDDLARTRYPSWSVEVAVSYPLGPARAEVDAARESLRLRQREAALRAAEHRVILEVNAAIREVETNYKRLETSATTVKLFERRLDGEHRKFASGLSTSFLVFQAQRDLSAAREAQARSLLEFHLATVDVAAVQVIPLGSSIPHP